MIDVFSERMSTWFSDMLTMSLYVDPGSTLTRLGVLVDLVEHDDGVVEREAEDREERDDGRRRDLEPEQRVHADVMKTSWTTATSAATAIRHSNRT